MQESSVQQYLLILAYILPVAVIFLTTETLRRRRTRKFIDRVQSNVREGLTEPPSLHPLIDTEACIGCGVCVRACPEKQILGMINDKAVLINATQCIGHGACARACPLQAISLVFGTHKRGVDIPLVKENFETNVPGIFIAGELGGMGLIRNAIEQGRQAMENIMQSVDTNVRGMYDVLVVGAGPAGIAATLGAIKNNLRYVTIEQEILGGTIAHYPRGKIVMTQAAHLPIVGKFKFGETTKEALMNFWQDVEKKTGMKIYYREKLENVITTDKGFIVKTSRQSYETKSILLCIGRRGSPRKLGVEGESLPKVVYRLIDSEQYRGQHVTVVGGGDSALEAAASITEQPGTHVTLSYRGDAFSRAKEKNRQRVEMLQAKGELNVILNSNVKNITHDSITIEMNGSINHYKNDAVIISAGGELPTNLLKQMGIQIDTKFGAA